MRIALVTLNEPWAVRDRAVVFRRGEPLTRLARQLIDALKERRAGGLAP
ncbi:hypothetical protein KTN05_11025 [Paracoccus sp. Z118]|nr:hypothetical protein [Paracoccus sp. Z118]MBV0892384.1 hypothetical protein [Paracoccus sp. Z118]